MQKSQTSNFLNATVWVAALGYFVDIFDLQLFNIIGRDSFAGLGITDPKIMDALDVSLFNWQMFGMLVGGLLWGILGDKKGRKSVLFGSILIYSLANIANAFVVSPEQYSAVRFIAGFGLAGELGAAITLVSEILTKENRGYGTMIIVTLGALGAVFAALIANNDLSFWGLQTWQVAYLIGGGLGLMLLFLRFGTFESGIFEKMQQEEEVRKGHFFSLFTDGKRFWKYLCCILIGLPVWYSIGILIKFSAKFAGIIGITDGNIAKGYPIMYAYIGLSVGDLLSGWLSQIFQNRKKVVIGYILACISLAIIFLNIREISANTFYFFCFLIGATTGFWALFVTIAAEQFGTNIRSTVTTTVPNFVRGAVVPITLGFKALEKTSDSITAATIVGVICIGLALIATLSIEETFHKDLDYVE